MSSEKTTPPAKPRFTPQPSSRNVQDFLNDANVSEVARNGFYCSTGLSPVDEEGNLFTLFEDGQSAKARCDELKSTYGFNQADASKFVVQFRRKFS